MTEEEKSKSRPVKLGTLLEMRDSRIPNLRGMALDSYALLERRLCSLLAFLGNMEGSVAATIFYRIHNARTISRILETLKKRKLGDQYQPFWKSAMDLACELSETRNQIVHWQMATLVTAMPDGIPLVEHSLRPQEFWHSQTKSTHTEETLVEFCKKCNHVSGALGDFLTYLQHPEMPQLLGANSPEKFRERLAWEPQDNVSHAPTQSPSE